MHRLARHWIQTSLAAALLAATACSSGGEGGSDPAPFPSGAGIQQDVSLTSLRSAGWTVCYQDDYATFGPDVGTILAGCPGRYLALACRFQTNDLLALLAADEDIVVTQTDAATATDHHVANGVGWYLSGGWSWGFFPAGATLDRAPCDSGGQAQDDKRLCWPVSSSGNELAEGFRCGATVGLAGSTSWQRLVLAHP